MQPVRHKFSSIGKNLSEYKSFMKALHVLNEIQLISMFPQTFTNPVFHSQRVITIMGMK